MSTKPYITRLTLLALLTVWTAIGQAQTDCKTILIVGDSLSAAYNMRTEDAWPELLQRRLEQMGDSKACWRVMNASIAGETVEGSLRRLSDFLAMKPAIVVLELGGNDGLRGYPPQKIEQNLRQLVVSFQQHGAQVVLTGIRLPPNYGQAYGEAFSATYQTVANETGALLVDFFMKGVGGVPELMQDDGLHPNEKAQPVLLANLWPKLREAMARAGSYSQSESPRSGDGQASSGHHSKPH